MVTLFSCSARSGNLLDEGALLGHQRTVVLDLALPRRRRAGGGVPIEQVGGASFGGRARVRARAPARELLPARVTSRAVAAASPSTVKGQRRRTE